MLQVTLLVLAIAASCSGLDFWNDLRVTWAPTSASGYERMPRNTVDAERDGWVKLSSTCDNDGKWAGFRWADPNDDAVVLMYDVNGYVSGIQSLTRHEDIMTPANTYHYGAVPIFQNDTLNGIDYLVVTMYFVRPELVCSTGRTNKDNIGNSSEIFFQNGPTPNELRDVPKTRETAINQGWSMNMCVPGMGWHNFYQVEQYPDHECDEVQPHCILFNEKDEMIGLCLNMQGMATSPRYEYPSSEAVQYVLGPNPAPQCVIDATQNAGTTTLHIYFVNTPWSVGC